MKKIFALLLAALMCVSLCACGDKAPESKDGDNKKTFESLSTDEEEKATAVSTTEENDRLSDSTGIKHTGKKISGEITGASAFSEGLAFVCLNGNKELTYCINKDGYIVFELDKKLVINGDIYEKFINGHVLIDGGICDTKGKIVYPEEVGATKFYSIAFEGGYIIAEKITSDYSSSKKELGVMNMDFEWVVQPSEEIYNAVGESMFWTTALNTESFYAENFVYIKDAKKYLNLKTGEVTDTADIKLPSNKWVSYTDNTFRDYDENVIVDLSEHQNMVLTAGSFYKNGKAPVKFYNQEADTHFYTLINEQGEFLFEPVEVKTLSNIGYMKFDGENTIVLDSMIGVEGVQSYNSKGELLGEFYTKSLGKNMSYSCEIGDGVIVVRGGYNFSSTCYYFNTDFTPLF